MHFNSQKTLTYVYIHCRQVSEDVALMLSSLTSVYRYMIAC